MSPGQLLKTYLITYIKENNLDKDLEKEIPKKWEKYGDFVLFDERTFCSNVWKSRDEFFWSCICKILQCKRIGVKNKIKNDGFRSPNVRILHGNDPWVIHKDNFITYTWNVEKSMFSAGNACEKQRIAKLNCENEIVVDLFAGIGYFTLPFLIHSKAKFVHACEWNPFAVEALKRNLVTNKVNDKCIIHEGDNLTTCPKKIANRVNLGLIPTSENHWKVACDALVNDGGILHIHENIETKKFEISCEICSVLNQQKNAENITKNIVMNSSEKSITEGETGITWKNTQSVIKGYHILHSLITILSNSNSNKKWHCSVEDISFVKSYAPHISHVVFDVKVHSS